MAWNIRHLDVLSDPCKYTVSISLISVSDELQRFTTVSTVEMAGSVVLCWATDQKVNALTGSNSLRVY